jgi:transcriptional regulator with XRE-family HTH domain
MAKVRDLRLKNFWSQDKLAKLSGVSRATIVAVERKQHKPQPITIHKLAKALGVEPDEIDDYDNVR